MNIFQSAVASFCRAHNYAALMPAAALIDMDGTLYDSMPGHADAWMKMVSELGIDASMDEFFMYEGRTGASTINLLFRRAFGRDATEEEKRDLYHRKTVYFAEQPPVDPMPGASEMLAVFTAAGIRSVLVTGSGQNTLLYRLDDDFPGMFASDMRVTSRDVEHGKPHPEPYLKGLEKAGVEPYRAIAVENAPLGVESASRAGIFTVGVATGPIPQGVLYDAGAVVTFGSMKDFAAMLPQLISAMRGYTPDFI